MAKVGSRCLDRPYGNGARLLHRNDRYWTGAHGVALGAEAP
jgi:hypothetical protein